MYTQFQSLIIQLKTLIKRAYVSAANSDVSDYPINQVTFFGDKAADAERISPYGLYCNLPVDTQVLLFSVNSQSENKAVIGYAQKERFKNLLPGEIVVGNIISNTFIKFDNQGNIEIDAKQDININVTGKVNVNATQVNLGSGGQPIARLGDAVSVDTGTGLGTITGGGTNTSL